jgi:hypothetical protein
VFEETNDSKPGLREEGPGNAKDLRQETAWWVIKEQ